MDKIKKALTSAKDVVVKHRATIVFGVTATVLGSALIESLHSGGQMMKSYEDFLADKDLLSEYHKFRYPAED
jgi:hypothetical protein